MTRVKQVNFENTQRVPKLSRTNAFLRSASPVLALSVALFSGAVYAQDEATDQSKAEPPAEEKVLTPAERFASMKAEIAAAGQKKLENEANFARAQDFKRTETSKADYVDAQARLAGAEAAYKPLKKRLGDYEDVRKKWGNVDAQLASLEADANVDATHVASAREKLFAGGELSSDEQKIVDSLDTAGKAELTAFTEARDKFKNDYKDDPQIAANAFDSLTNFEHAASAIEVAATAARLAHESEANAVSSLDKRIANTINKTPTMAHEPVQITPNGLGAEASGNEAWASGHLAKASGDDSVAVGVKVQARGEKSTAMGHDVVASGKRSTAYGEGAIAAGEDSTAIGAGAVAKGDKSYAAGVDALALGEQSTAVGHNANAGGSRSTAFGAGAVATVEGATAIGNDAVARAKNSVAIGDSSVADREDSVSVGAEGRERLVTNVRDGREGTDAVNVRQLRRNADSAEVNAVRKSVNYTDQKVTQLRGEIGAVRNDMEQMDKNFRKGIASSAALQMAMPYAPGRIAVNAGTAFYRGQGAIAVGSSYWNEKGTWNVNGGISTAGGNSTIVRAGVGVLF